MAPWLLLEVGLGDCVTVGVRVGDGEIVAVDVPVREGVAVCDPLWVELCVRVCETDGLHAVLAPRRRTAE